MKLFHIAVPLSMVCWAFIAMSVNSQRRRTCRRHNRTTVWLCSDVNVLWVQCSKLQEFGESVHDTKQPTNCWILLPRTSYAERNCVQRALVVSEKVHGDSMRNATLT